MQEEKLHFHHLNNYFCVADTSKQTKYIFEHPSEQFGNESSEIDLHPRKKDSWSELDSLTTVYGKKRCGKTKLNYNPFIISIHN